MSFIQILLLILLLFSLSVALRYNQSSKSKTGCLTLGYVFLVVFVIGLFVSFMTYFMTQQATKDIDAYMNGEKCTAYVVSYSSYNRENNDGDIVRMHKPQYRIVTEAGNIYNVEIGDSSSKVPTLGDSMSVYFNEKDQYTLYFSASTLFLVCFLFIIWLILFFAFLGSLVYVFGCDMAKFINISQKVGIYFILPVIMLAFEALLIYALFNNDERPLAVTIILSFFVLVLGLGLVAYAKVMFEAKLIKWQRGEDGVWGEEEDEGDERAIKTRNRMQRKIKRKKKAMIPLNEKYLKDTDESKNNYKK